MADDIIQFSPGGKVTAEETNENNLLLKEWALDNSQSEAYIDGKIATLTSNLNQQISSLNSQIATKAPLSNPTLTGTVKCLTMLQLVRLLILLLYLKVQVVI